jgi:5-methylcytosine-specific restriction endonuclease McrA
LLILERDRYTCQLRDEGCTSYATEVDHIDGIAVTGIPRPQALNPKRLRAVCHECHTKRTHQQAADARRSTTVVDLHPGQLR